MEEFIIIAKSDLDRLEKEMAAIRQTQDKIRERQTGLEIAIHKETPEASEAIGKLEKAVNDISLHEEKIEAIKNEISSITKTLPAPVSAEITQDTGAETSTSK